MKIHWKIILIILDAIIFLFGGQFLIVGLLNNSYYKDFGTFDIGVIMVTLGLLIHYWRHNYFNLIHKWKIILIVVDLITIGFGIFSLMAGLIRNLYFKDYGDIELGGFMITLGLLIHYWFKNYFGIIKKETNQ